MNVVIGAWLLTVAVAAAGDDGGKEACPPADRIDTILTQLEKRSDGLKDIRCRVRFVEDDRVNLSTRTKTGEILFLITEPNPTFMIHFERTETDGIVGKREWYLFDGRWLYQAIERIKQVTKQEVVRAEESVDLFDLENAPFPLPFGQKKEKILDNFEVSLVAPVADDPPDTDHLVCLPKPNSRLQGKYEKLEFYVRRDIHLPSRVVVTKNDGYEINRADFPDLGPASINAGVKKKDFAKPPEWRGYKEVVEALDAPD